MAEIAKRIALAAAALLAGLLVAEGLLRWLAPIPYSMAVEYEPDGHIVGRLTPRRVYELADGGRVTVNRLGFRRPGRLDWEKPADVLRLAALGGSSTFSYNTDDAAVWTAQLERLVAEATGRRVEVVNAGQPGMGAFDSRFNWLYRVRELQPDAVIVYHGWNDLKHFRAVEAGERLVRRGPYRPDPIERFLRRLQLAWRVRALVKPSAPGAPPPRPEGATTDSWFDDIRISDGGRAHRWARRSYDDLASMISADGALPVFVGQASLVSEAAIADPARRERIYIEYAQLSYEEVLRQLSAIREIARDSARANGALFVDAYPEVPHTLEYFLDHVHLTAAGNTAVAEAVFRGLPEAQLAAWSAR